MKKILSLILIAVITTVMLSGCFNKINYNRYVYDHADKYSVGDMTFSDTVTKIEVEWVKGSVRIETGAVCSVKETYAGALSDDMKLHYWLDGTTLRIRFAESGVMDFNKIELEKTLTVTIPEGSVPEKIYLVTASAAATVSASAQTLEVSTVSGSIDVSLYNWREMTLNSVSGDICVSSPQAETIQADTVSGDIVLHGINCKSVKADSVSGNIDLEFTANISGFTAEIDTLSGNIENSFEITQKKDSCVYGDGSIHVEIDTISGNITIGNTLYN